MMLQWLLLSSLEVLIANSMYFNGDYFVKIDFSPKLTDSVIITLSNYILKIKMGTVPAKSMITSHRSKTKNNNSSNLFSKWALFPIFWHRIHQTMNPFIKKVITRWM